MGLYGSIFLRCTCPLTLAGPYAAAPRHLAMAVRTTFVLLSAVTGTLAMPVDLYRPTSGGAYLPPHARGGRLARTNPELLPPIDFGPKPSEKMYLEVPLDHFDPTNTKTWKDKFYINRGYWDEKDGPIFVEMGGGTRSTPCDFSPLLQLGALSLERVFL